MRATRFKLFAFTTAVAALSLTGLTLVADDKGPATKPAGDHAANHEGNHEADHGGGAMPGQMDEAAMMAAWESYAKPGPEHAKLAEMAGEWTAVVEDLTPGMGNEKSEGTATSKMIMGGRYLCEEFKGTMMGQPFEGMSITGYDNKTGKYFSTWIDSMSTGLATSHGTASDGTMNMTGKMTCPMTEEPLSTKTTITTMGNDKQVMEMTMTAHDGTPMGEMRITYTRAK